MQNQINILPISQFAQSLRAAELGQQKEVKLPIQQARLLNLALLEIQDKLLQDYESILNTVKTGATNDVVTIRYDTKDLLRGDTAARYSSYSVGIQWGFLSPNDARHAENLPPIAGGDRYLEPLNMMAKNDILDQKATNGKNAQTN